MRGLAHIHLIAIRKSVTVPETGCRAWTRGSARPVIDDRDSGWFQSPPNVMRCSPIETPGCSS
jgi:hypothetical protein